MESIWSKGTECPSFDILQNDIRTDVLIIGGGIAGVLCGFMLKNAGVDCVIAEADTVCSGVTESTTAKITVQHGLIFNKMIKRYGVDYAKQYLKAQNEALKQYRLLSEKHECDFKESDSFVYSLNNKGKIQDEAEALKLLGCDAGYVGETELPFEIAGAVRAKNQAQFHPLKLLLSLAKELKIFEYTRVLELTPYGAVTECGNIKANKTIVATHFPFLKKHGAYFLKMYQHRSYVLALKNAQALNGMYVDEAEVGMSFRSYGDLLLLGGGGHRTGKKGGDWAELRRFAEKFYPNSTEVGFWATQDCMTLDGIPYIGRYSKKTPNLFVATGFNKWGMTNALVSAKLLCDLVCDKDNEFAEIFSPQRTVLRPQLAVNGFESAKNLLTPTVPRCPHLGCALKYNKQEHSWDCPCHGSRFSKDGKLLDNPANKGFD